MSEPLKTCYKCGLEAHTKDELKLFIKKDIYPNGREAICKSCRNEDNRTHRKENKEHYAKKDKHYHCKYKYGITLDEYDKRMSTSDCCEICGSKESLCYDHCHITKDFRGVLCRTCNLGLGQLGDTLESIQKVVAYLSKELILGSTKVNKGGVKPKFNKVIGVQK